MAETKLINFRHGTYDEIHGLGKDANCIYFASDKPLFYAVGKWHGIASMTSEVDRVNSKTILKINGDGGYAINCEIEGETLSKDLKEKLINAYEFVQLISGEDEDAIINKWNDIVAFLQGFGEADKLLNVVVELQNNLADEVANRISADLKHTEDIKSITDLVNDMFTLVDKGDGTKFIQSKYGFASDSFISARGVDEESSGVGGLDAQAVWDLLMQNDDATKVINVAHIPDISIAKITDIANASVANAVNAEMVGGMTTRNFVKQDCRIDANAYNENSVGYGYQDGGWRTSGPALNIGSVQGYSMLMQMDAWDGAIYTKRRVKGVLDESWKQLAFRETTLSGYGITDAVDLTSDQNISGAKTFSNFRVNNSTMVTNLNAEMVGGVKAENIARQKVGIDINNGDRNYMGYGYGSNGWYQGGGPAICAGIQDYYMMLFGYPNALYYKYDGIGYPDQTWKTIVFTDTNSLTPSGGTLTINGNLKVSNQLTIGNATLYWDVANQCLRVNSGIASDSFLSAKGIDTTGNGQGGGGGFDATMLWNELTIPSPTNAGKAISSQFLPVQEILTPVATDISAINEEIIALQDRIANIEQALTWQGVS